MKKALLSVSVLATFVLALLAQSASAAEEFDKFGLESVSASLSSPQAGAHADLTTSFKLTRDPTSMPYARAKDIEVQLPPGVMGNPQAVPRCTASEFGTSPSTSECPTDSQVGVTEIRVINPVAGTFTEPIYNMPSPGGDIVARLGFFAVEFPTFINVRLNPTDYSLVATIEGAPSAAGLLEATTTLWGIPASPTHNEQRITPEEVQTHKIPPGGHEPGLPEAPFLSNPTDCSMQRQVTVTARSYQMPEAASTMSAPFPQIIGCGKLGFAPVFSAVPTNPEAAAPTGLDAELRIPQDETAQGRATSTLKSATVTLPPGLTINPSAADGLAACSAAEVGFGRNEPSHCPDAAKIGSATLEVPALEETLQGWIYQRTPEPGHLFRFWLVADAQGVHLKLPAEIEADETTGQLTTVFGGLPALAGNPQVPVADFKFHIFGGPRAPLSTPASCGGYETRYAFAPWSGNPASEGGTAMQITSGCGKGGFSPVLSAGALNSSAGGYSPFAFTLRRSDGESNPQAVALHLPQGLLAKVAGVPLCSDEAASTGNCPGASRIGSVIAATGVGGAPLWLPQLGKAATAVYLAGPYKGAPWSVVSVVPAQAGPFDLGTVVNRAKIAVDPESALATIETEPLPQILKGVPVTYRMLHVNIDRPEFTLNPTSCERKEVEAQITASDGLIADPRDPFQASNCAKLRYSPKLKLSLKGATKRSGHPQVKAVLTQPAGEANSKQATVLLPASEMIEQAHINNPCTRVQFNADECPARSVLGHATAVTPLLDQPLRGPIYFRSNGGARALPDIVADLHGPLHIILVGYVDAVPGKDPEEARIRTRFVNIPDAPVTRFSMSFFGGKRGLLVNNQPLCKADRRVKIQLEAQNGRQRKSNRAIAVACAR